MKRFIISAVAILCILMISTGCMQDHSETADTAAMNSAAAASADDAWKFTPLRLKTAMIYNMSHWDGHVVMTEVSDDDDVRCVTKWNIDDHLHYTSSMETTISDFFMFESSDSDYIESVFTDINDALKQKYADNDKALELLESVKCGQYGKYAYYILDKNAVRYERMLLKYLDNNTDPKTGYVIIDDQK